MTTLETSKNPTICENGNLHTPNKQAVSAIASGADIVDLYTFCEVCEQNINAFVFYDEDRGSVVSKWANE